MINAIDLNYSPGPKCLATPPEAAQPAQCSLITFIKHTVLRKNMWRNWPSMLYPHAVSNKYFTQLYFIPNKYLKFHIIFFHVFDYYKLLNNIFLIYIIQFFFFSFNYTKMLISFFLFQIFYVPISMKMMSFSYWLHSFHRCYGRYNINLVFNETDESLILF